MRQREGGRGRGYGGRGWEGGKVRQSIGVGRCTDLGGDIF